MQCPCTLDIINIDLYKTMLATNILLEKLNNPIFRNFFESHLSVTLPSVMTFRTKYLPHHEAKQIRALDYVLKVGNMKTQYFAQNEELAKNIESLHRV